MKEYLANYKEKLIKALNVFDQFCTNNNLNYYASGGTAIGVVRHKGFIPWDDDIDVVMPRDDYNRMLKLRNTLDPKKYYIKALGDKDVFYTYGKFCDANTTLIETKEFPKCVIGVYIDIFPIDEVSDNLSDTKLKKSQFDYLKFKFLLTHHHVTLSWIVSLIANLHLTTIRGLLSCNYSNARKEFIRNQFMQFESEWQKDHGSAYYNHSAFYTLEKELLDKKWFSDYCYMEFENTKIRMMKGYEKYLSQLFGDYMTPPPPEKRVSNHSHYYLNLKEGLSYEEAMLRIKQDEYLVY